MSITAPENPVRFQKSRGYFDGKNETMHLLLNARLVFPLLFVYIWMRIGEKSYTLKSTTSGGVIESKDEVIKVTINIDGHIQILELKN